MESTGVDQDNQKWITVSYNNSYNINNHDSELVNVKNPYLTPNRFASLTNLKEDQQTVPSIKCNTNLPPVTHTSMKPANQRGPGSKLPTIVNGRISYNLNVKKSTKLSSKVKPSSTVKIIGDSFLNPLNPVLVLVPSSLSRQQSGLGTSTNTIFINFLKKKVLGVLASGLYH